MENIADKETVFATRIQRIVAFIIDYFIIGIVGYLSGLILSDFYISLGNYGRLIGFAITLLYFSLCDSFLLAGQTLGKKIIGIKVVNHQSKLLSIQFSFLRSLVFSFTILFNGLSLSDPKQAYLVLIVSFIFITICLFELFYFVLYKKTDQFFHDILLNTFVVCKSNGIIEHIFSLKIVRWSLAIPIITVLILTITNIITPTKQVNDMSILANTIQNTLPLNNTMVSRGVTKFFGTSGNSETKYVSITTLKKSLTDTNEFLAIEIARIAITSGFNFQEDEILSIQINSGYDIAIARNFNYEMFRLSLEEWNNKINK